MRVYIAGPYGDHNPKDVIAQNIANADKAARDLVAMGHLVFCPHKMTAGWEDDERLRKTSAYYILDTDILTHWAEAIYRLPGESKGSDGECAVAEQLGIPIYYKTEDIPQSVGHHRFPSIANRLIRLHIKKSADYGSDINPLGNIVACRRMGLSPLVGIALRLQDKMARLESFVRKGSLKNEGIADTLQDIAVYAMLALLEQEE